MAVVGGRNRQISELEIWPTEQVQGQLWIYKETLSRRTKRKTNKQNKHKALTLLKGEGRVEGGGRDRGNALILRKQSRSVDESWMCALHVCEL